MREGGCNQAEWNKIAANFVEAKRPKTREHLTKVVKVLFGVDLIATARCPDHTCQLDYVAGAFLGEYTKSVHIAARGGGKSYLAALTIILDALYKPGINIAVTAFVRDQSGEVQAKLMALLEEFDKNTITRSTYRRFSTFGHSGVEFANGSKIGFFSGAKSQANVKSFHPQIIVIDEADTWPVDALEQVPFALYDDDRFGTRLDILSADYSKGANDSAIHREIERLEAYNKGLNPMLKPARVFRMCLFDTVKKCDDRFQCWNDAAKAHCPLWKYCQGKMKATAIQGHSSLAKAMEEAGTSSKAHFEAQMLLIRQQTTERSYFKDFTIADHVLQDEVEYDPSKETLIAWDFGGGRCVHATVIAQRDSEGVYYILDALTSEHNLEDLIATVKTKYPNVRWKHAFADPAGNKKQFSTGSQSYTDILRLNGFPVKKKGSLGRAVTFQMVCDLIAPADGKVRLKVNKRCKALIDQIQAAEHKWRKGQPLDEPENILPDDLLDCLRYIVAHTKGKDMNAPGVQFGSMNDLMTGNFFQRRAAMTNKARRENK